MYFEDAISLENIISSYLKQVNEVCKVYFKQARMFIWFHGQVCDSVRAWCRPVSAQAFMAPCWVALVGGRRPLLVSLSLPAGDS